MITLTEGVEGEKEVDRIDDENDDVKHLETRMHISGHTHTKSERTLCSNRMIMNE